jgi:O-antigen/teichoic acid export membrane protein
LTKGIPQKHAHLHGAFWTLADQAAVSLGAFAINVQLARLLSPQDYGTFALLLGGYFLIQHVNASLIYYPLMVRLAGGNEKRPTDLVFASVTLTGASTLLLGAVLAVFLCIFGRQDIALAGTCYVLFWQIQDAHRRALLAEFQHRIAAVSDAITYLGGAGAIASLAATGSLSLVTALFAMTAACVVAVAAQAAQRYRMMPSRNELRVLTFEYWDFGKWAFVNGLILTLSMQIFPWSLAILHGTAAAAGFQAVLNIANLANPITFGLCNAILPAAARAHESLGLHEAWRTARKYITIGIALTASYAVPLLCVPWLALRVLYGPNSAYADLSTALSITVVAVAINSIADMIYTFINGVKGNRLVLGMNIWGLAATAVALPFAATYGVEGCALLLAASRLFRLIASWHLVARILSPGNNLPWPRPIQASGEGRQ